MSDYVDYLTFLSAQEDGTVVEDADGDWGVMQNGDWHGVGNAWDFSSAHYASYGPFKVISLPVKEATP